MVNNIKSFILLFFVYSFIGWCMEVAITIIKNKKLVNRGFLVGPLCPIYGWGVLLLTLFLKKYSHDWIATFAMSILICGILEYLTSYFMEILFGARWWDYSERKFNINGRICLETLIPFGIGGTFVLEFVNPFFIDIIRNIPAALTNFIIVVLLFVFTVDTIISFKIVSKFKILNTLVKDNTEEISRKVTEEIYEKKEMISRMISAFPHLDKNGLIKNWFAGKYENLKEKIREISNEL
ncbi:MAG: putative ABC transporter permease [Bacillota bacterium]|nr:putative ABC transporter permease [Bacillota bacterium]